MRCAMDVDGRKRCPEISPKLEDKRLNLGSEAWKLVPLPEIGHPRSNLPSRDRRQL